MTDRDSLLAAILADPACDVKRLAYADLLEDSGEVERAEFIRRQVAHEPSSSPPPLTMLAETEAFLSAGVNSAVEYRRGFISSLRGPLLALLEHGPAIVAEHPVERVGVLGAPLVRKSPIFHGGWNWFPTDDDEYMMLRDLGLPAIGGEYATQQAAIDAFNAAVLAELRRRAGATKSPG